MADIQHREARVLLKKLPSIVSKNQKLTYSQAATLLGRAPGNSRAVAGICNLLDAAACLAGVPILALVTIRAQSGGINPKAFNEFDEPRRSEIFKRSLNYQFGPSDYAKIASALDDLGQRGAKTAWHFVQKLYPGNLYYLRLVGDYSDSNADAIDDLGTDSPDRTRSEIWSYPRNPKVRNAVIKRANGHCELCRKPGFLKPDNSRYLESHHVIALAQQGEDRVTNVIALCPEEHREAHFGVRSKELEAEMIIKLKALNESA